jgi:superfamily II DNA or RNA helicase
MYESNCDLLVLDEIHRYASDMMAKIFSKVHYSMILGLTATIERLDGKEIIIKKYAPVCDTITLDEALENGWVAPVKQYLVLLDVDLTEYKKLDQKFNNYFSFFGYD